MEAVRTVRNIRSSRITLDIPPSLRRRKVEILVLPLDEAKAAMPVDGGGEKRLASFLQFVAEHPLRLPVGYQFNREELHVRGVL